MARRTRARKLARKSARNTAFLRKPRRPPPRPLYRATEALMAHGKMLFETTSEPIPAIAAVMGCNRSTVYRIARTENWVRYAPPPRDLPRAVKLAAEAEALPLAAPGGRHPEERAQRASPPPQDDGESARRGEAGPPAPNGSALPPDLPPVADTVVRMYRAALEELAAVETMRAQLKRQPQSPLDAERTSRTLSSLQALVERLQRQQLGLLTSGSDDDDDDFPTDIDEFRNELARRIDAFVASRTEPEDTDGEAVAARVAES